MKKKMFLVVLLVVAFAGVIVGCGCKNNNMDDGSNTNKNHESNGVINEIVTEAATDVKEAVTNAKDKLEEMATNAASKVNEAATDVKDSVESTAR